MAVSPIFLATHRTQGTTHPSLQLGDLMTSYTSTISRIQGDIADLHKRDAHEAKKESELTGRIARAMNDASRTKSIQTHISKLKDVERYQRDIADVRRKRAEYSAKMASKTKDLHTYSDRQATEDDRERRKIADEQKKLIREREDHERRISAEIRSRTSISRTPTEIERQATLSGGYDFFIAHASEDKDEIVRSLAEELHSLGAKVFYDEFTLRVGDSLRRKIDQGLATSRFGVVVLSEHFFKKEWPARELDGLVTQEVAGKTRILPIWHKVSKDEVASFSPTLADKVALNTSVWSVKKIATELHSLLS